ncbi:MAG TPA: SPOCS domain-containing protein [Mobilitalea sp.]|nr:SPOCS domain-containing protein [Mobilitalea sp.]
MELIKKNIHMNKLKCKSTLQLTLDDDFNVPDIKPDIEKIIKEQGDIKITDIKAMNGKLLVKGSLDFNVLYLSDDDQRPVHNISGEIPFDEVINMEATCADDEPIVKWELEDLSSGLINSRKLSVKSIVRLNVSVEDLYDEETAVAVEGPEDVQSINKKIEVTDVAINKKDTYRLKDEIQIPSNKGNITSLLFYDVRLNNVEARLLEDKFSIKGELPVFLLYTSDDEENPIEYYETEIPFSGTIDCNGCTEDMIEDIGFGIANKSLAVKPDADGEERVVDLEVILDMDIKVYAIEEPEILSDVYSPTMEITPVIRNATYENLVIKNNSKYRIADRIRVPDTQPRMLQICHANGDIKIDDIIPVDTELQVEGVIEVGLLYISEDDNRPLNSLKGAIPFSQIIEVKGMKSGSNYEVKPNIDQLSVMMLDSDEIEVKATMSLNTIVFDKITEAIITDVEVADLDLQKLQAMPGLIGYVVKPYDTLWKIAKKYYTTVDSIKSINDLDNDNIREGDKLIIMKKVGTVL